MKIYLRATPKELVDHILTMADDAYLIGHPEWMEIVQEARQVNANLQGGQS